MGKTIFFDVWWTLIDSDDVFTYILDRIWFDGSYEQEFHQYFSNIFSNMTDKDNFKEVWEILWEAINIMCIKYKMEDKSHMVKDLYLDCFTNTGKLFDSVRETLLSLKTQWWQLIVVSDSDAKVMRQELLQFKLWIYFDKILISSEIKSYKPSDETVKTIINKIIFDSSTSFFIGDSSSDQWTAKKLGIKFIYARHGKKESLMANDYTIDNLQDMINIVNQAI